MCCAVLLSREGLTATVLVWLLAANALRMLPPLLTLGPARLVIGACPLVDEPPGEAPSCPDHPSRDTRRAWVTYKGSEGLVALPAKARAAASLEP